MAAPGALRGPARPPAGPSPPRLQNSRRSLRKEPISTLHSPLHSRGNHISLGEPQAVTPQPGQLPPGTDAGEQGPASPLPSPKAPLPAARGPRAPAPNLRAASQRPLLLCKTRREGAVQGRMLARRGPSLPASSGFLEGQASGSVQGLGHVEAGLNVVGLPSGDKASVPMSHGPPNSQGNRRR